MARAEGEEWVQAEAGLAGRRSLHVEYAERKTNYDILFTCSCPACFMNTVNLKMYVTAVMYELTRCEYIFNI